MPHALSVNDLGTLAANWRSAGLYAVLADDLDESLARYNGIGAQYRAYRDSKSLLADLGRRVASGDATLEQAIATHASSRNKDSALAVFDAARRQVLTDALNHLRSFGADLITDHLAPRHAELYDQAAKHAKTIGDTATPEDAFAAGGKVTAAWHALADLHDVDTAMHKAYSALLRSGALTGRWDHPHPELVPGANRDEVQVGTVRPTLVRTGTAPARNPVRRFADLVLSDAGSKVLLADDEHATATPTPPDAA